MAPRWMSIAAQGKRLNLNPERTSAGNDEGKQTYDDAEICLLPHQIQMQRQSSLLTRIVNGCCIFTVALFMVSYVLLAYYALSHSNGKTCLLGNEGIYDDMPIIYRNARFQRAGFHDSRHGDATIYEGVPNERNNAAWERLLNVGVVSISNQENSRLVNGSASTRHNPNEHIVELEMFHQLHCLKWLRDRFWESEGAAGTPISLPQQQNHTDHCIDYLRQTIMCHGDVTPITFEWNEGISGFLAHHSTEHMCRDFGAIHDWAEQRDTTDLHAGGAHVNVELEQPEIFD